MKKLLLLIIPTAILAATAIFALTSTPSTIPANTTIKGIPLGGLNATQANQTLQDRFTPMVQNITITYTHQDNPVATFTLQDFGLQLDFTPLVDSALSRSFFGTKNIEGNIPITIHPQKLDSIISGIKRSVETTPVNASFRLEDNHIIIQPDIPGTVLDIQHLTTATLDALTILENTTISLQITSLPATYTTAHFDFETTALGTFSTTYTGDASDNRIYNVALAASKIDNHVLYPGEIFSAAATIGAHLPNSGYKPAIVLVNGEPVEDIGGGVCQVVSTLYNAVLLSELVVVERHNHSAPVSYVDKGFDATIAGDYLDLKFKNVTGHPVLISSHMQSGHLEISILGLETRPTNRHIRFAANILQTIDADYAKITDNALPPGAEEVRLSPQPGAKVELVKHVYIDNQPTDTHRINISTYKALEGVIAIGPR